MPVTRDVLKIGTGPFQLTYGSDSLGYTKGDAKFSYTPNYRPRQVDEMGQTPIDYVLGGEELKVTVTLKQEQVGLLLLVIPEGLAGGTTKWYMGRKPGGKASDHAKILELTPIDTTTTSISKIHFWKAVVIDPIEKAFSWESDSDFAVTFTILADTTKSDGQYLGYVQYAS